MTFTTSQLPVISSSQLPQSELAPEILEALTFERSKWATGSVHTDPFYTLPLKTTSDSSLPETLLKIQESVDHTSYSIPCPVSISRIIYQSLTLLGDPFLFLRRYFGLFSHEITQTVAPKSSPRSMIPPHFLAPCALVLSGYVVVAADYAGLSVSYCTQPQNQPIVHHYPANSVAANNVIYSIVAARSAFPSLGSKFSSIGNSQRGRGGAAWAITQHHAKEKIEEYLECIAISPTTDIRSNADLIEAIVWAGMMLGLKNVFPKFQYSDIFTEKKHAAVNTYRDVEGGGAVGMGLFLPLEFKRNLLRYGSSNITF
ncbi:hypothetical protein BHYA_0217g00170 [Botrytis hyacinthi]|uniref:Uncharacterized protein n=1 Tax=Botrytis hyacinthi TaxID=278943 RepID=A0A4Z1GAI9_9HELO|nr:hypothetical protein BHYA_0217g00170 [Botrytis hyacinthi]